MSLVAVALPATCSSAPVPEARNVTSSVRSRDRFSALVCREAPHCAPRVTHGAQIAALPHCTHRKRRAAFLARGSACKDDLVLARPLLRRARAQ